MYPQLYSMIAPNLFQGGTDDLDVIHLAQTNNRPRTDLPFDAIVTMYAWARPADWNIQEFRYGIPDAAITDIDLNRLRQAVEFGHERWKAGDRVRLVDLHSVAAHLNGKTGIVTDTMVSTLGSSDRVRVKLVGSSHAWYAADNLEPV